MPGWGAPEPPGWDGWGSPAEPPLPHADGIAIAAFVVGAVSVFLFFLFVPAMVAVVLGAVAWARIRRAGGVLTGRAFAGVGAGLGVLSLVAAGLLVGALANSNLLDGHLTRYASLQLGDCFSAPTGLIRAMNVFQVVNCSQAHDREVAALVTDPSSGSAPYPGSQPLTDEGNRLCPDQVRAYVGGSLDPSRYTPWFYYPRQTNWDSGDRTIVCTVRSVGAKAKGSVRSGPPATA